MFFSCGNVSFTKFWHSITVIVSKLCTRDHLYYWNCPYVGGWVVQNNPKHNIMMVPHMNLKLNFDFLSSYIVTRPQKHDKITHFIWRYLRSSKTVWRSRHTFVVFSAYHIPLFQRSWFIIFGQQKSFAPIKIFIT